MKKKILATLICISLMATMLAGCGNEGNQDSSAGSVQSVSGGRKLLILRLRWKIRLPVRM